jgi:hypothetical protein
MVATVTGRSRVAASCPGRTRGGQFRCVCVCVCVCYQVRPGAADREARRISGDGCRSDSTGDLPTETGSHTGQAPIPGYRMELHPVPRTCGASTSAWGEGDNGDGWGYGPGRGKERSEERMVRLRAFMNVSIEAVTAWISLTCSTPVGRKGRKRKVFGASG